KAIAALRKLKTKVGEAQKEHKKNSELSKYLKSMADEVDKEIKLIEEEMKADPDEAEASGPNKALASALRRAKTGSMFFAVVSKSSSDGKLIMSRAKVKPTEVSAAKTALGGGGSVLRGICSGEKGIHVFFFRKAPPGTLERLIKTIAK